MARLPPSANSSGAKVRRMALPAIFAEAWRAHPPLQDYEAKQALAWEYAAHPEQIAPKLRQHLDEAQKIDAAAYDAARGTAHRARGALDEVFAVVDVLLTFSAPGPAPETLAATGSARFNRLWTLMGVPCVSVPGLANGDNLPVGVQVIGPFGRDERALDAARFVERAITAGRRA